MCGPPFIHIENSSRKITSNSPYGEGSGTYFCPWKQGSLFTHEVILILVETAAHSRKTTEMKHVKGLEGPSAPHTDIYSWLWMVGGGEEKVMKRGTLVLLYSPLYRIFHYEHV